MIEGLHFHSLPMEETQETQVPWLNREDPLEEGISHSSVLAWEIPRTEEPGGLRSTGSRRVGMTEPLSAAQPLGSL